MYVVVRTGGKQYRVEEGSVVTVGRLAGKAGDTVTLDDLLLAGDNEALKVGAAQLKGGRVLAEIVAQDQGPKIEVVRYKNKTRQKKTRGHRQELTTLRITKIEGLH